ncbi:MAG TPA: ATP-binding cassette domain-containing protein [Oligoflexia bacterium]|nr:ATP-binding cassette domain-containing protein [Oligoflexia bacterium]HMP26878.1 ATP-binding cassette domain-containing protein [Oligoflexia bacterium]
MKNDFIEVKHLKKSFGAQTVLSDISIRFNAGELTAVVGPSGVGKSVLLKLIIGILAADGGEVAVFGEKLNFNYGDRGLAQIRKNFGILFQSAALLDSMTIFENVAFPIWQGEFAGRFSKKQIEKKTREIMASLSLEPYAKALPQEVSIGIRKRAGLARALISSPKAVFFDEPNTGLDPLVGQEVYDLIKETKKRWGFLGIVISHELPEVFQVSDRVVMLFGGKVIADGTPEEFKNSENPAVIQFINGSNKGPIQINW